MFVRTEGLREFTRFYPVITYIIVLHLLLYLVTVLPIFPGRIVFESLAGVNLYIVEGEIWRLVTPIFIHSGFAHVLFNSFSLVLFGPFLERFLGVKRFLFLYFLSGIVANIATLLLKPLTYTHVGSSGAIYGLFGFYIALILFNKAALSRENSQVIMTIAAIGIVMTFIQPNVNITAHIFGLLAGYVFGYLSYSKNGDRSFSFNRRPVRRSISFSYRSPRYLLLWGAVLLLAILGLLSSIR